MSQIIKNLASGPVPPAVPTSFVTDVNSPSVPIANIENVKGGETTANVVHEVGSAERLGAEFDNRKLALGVKTKR